MILFSARCSVGSQAVAGLARVKAPPRADANGAHPAPRACERCTVDSRKLTAHSHVVRGSRGVRELPRRRDRVVGGQGGPRGKGGPGSPGTLSRPGPLPLRGTLVLGLSWLLACAFLCGCGEEAGSRREFRGGGREAPTAPSAFGQEIDLRRFWTTSLLPMPRTAGEDSHTLTFAGSTDEDASEELGSVPPPARGASKEDVRAYVVSVLTRCAGCSRERMSRLLSMVGAGHVDVLIEPLRFVPVLNESDVLVSAIGALVSEEHKVLVLGALAHVPDLIDVVVEREWTSDAAPVLLRALGERSINLDTRWVIAAAEICGREHHNDLRFHLLNGPNPRQIWMAIRGLPNMDPLDALVGSAWESARAGRDLYLMQEWAYVAAHHGHLSALAVLAADIGRGQIIDGAAAFRRLTGFAGSDEEATHWFEAEHTRLRWDSATRKYVTPAGDAR